MRKAIRLFFLGTDHGPLLVQLYLHSIEDRWAAMMVGDDAPPIHTGAGRGEP